MRFSLLAVDLAADKGIVDTAKAGQPWHMAFISLLLATLKGFEGHFVPTPAAFAKTSVEG